MATSLGSFNTRIQLKSDTEANWNAHPIVPLLGEMIIYAADNTHNYTRLKVGDGITNVINLPFIDAGTLNGEETEIVKKENFQAFPSPGSPDKLYIDLSTSRIYHFEPASGYTPLSNFNFSITKSTVGSVTNWSAGRMTNAIIEDNTFKVSNGFAPSLAWENRSVVTNVTKEE